MVELLTTTHVPAHATTYTKENPVKYVSNNQLVHIQKKYLL